MILSPDKIVTKSDRLLPSLFSCAFLLLLVTHPGSFLAADTAVTGTIKNYLSAASGGTEADPVLLRVELDLSNSAAWAELLTVISAAGKYTALDLSACGTGSAEFDPDSRISTGKEKIVSLILPDRATGIAGVPGSIFTSVDSTFKHFSKLKSIKGENIEIIGKYAFVNCDALATADFPSAAHIGHSSFSGTALTRADFPAATRIESGAFAGCTALTNVNIPAAAGIDGYAFLGCDALETASFPAAAYIGLNAFSGCTALTRVDFPAVTGIGENAFRNCAALETASFPAATYIGKDVFFGCAALKAVNFPVLEHIGYPFRNCEALETVNFPAVTYVRGMVII
jgi:hypothetical protein